MPLFFFGGGVNEKKTKRKNKNEIKNLARSKEQRVKTIEVMSLHTSIYLGKRVCIYACVFACACILVLLLVLVLGRGVVEGESGNEKEKKKKRNIT